MGHFGHLAQTDSRYRLLQIRLGGTPSGAPPTEALLPVLRLLYSPDDAELAARLPLVPETLGDVARRVGLPADQLRPRLESLAQRGLALDAQYQGELYVALSPVIFGFFEFTFMRVRDDVPQAELAELFERYLHGEEEETVFRGVFGGATQMGRTFVDENALPPDTHAEVLDWERIERILRQSESIAVSLCACRHKARHLGRACDGPQEVCLAMDYFADMVVRHGFARRIDAAEALHVLEQCRAAGLAQLGDNVKRRVAYLCNCCGCCCEMLQAIRRLDVRGAVVPSAWIAAIDAPRCAGCGRCAKACPTGAIDILPASSGTRNVGRHSRVDQTMMPAISSPSTAHAVVDAEACLGCGVCCRVCKTGAAHLNPRGKRPWTPETVFDRLAAMALERGKLAELIFNAPRGLGGRALYRVVRLLERTPLVRAAAAIAPLRSILLERLVAAAKRRVGPLADRVT